MSRSVTISPAVTPANGTSQSACPRRTCAGLVQISRWSRAMFFKSCKPSLFSAVSFDAVAISFLAFVLGLPVSSAFGRTSSRVVSCELLCASALGVAQAVRPENNKSPKEQTRWTG